MWPISLFLSRQTFRYAACGGLNYLVLNPLVYSLCYNFVVSHRFIDLGFIMMSPHIAALCITLPVIFFTGFWLNRNVAFRGSPVRTHTQLFRYLLTLGGSVLLSYVGMKFFVEVCHVWPTPANVLTTLVSTVYSFLAAKYFTFRHSERL